MIRIGMTLGAAALLVLAAAPVAAQTYGQPADVQASAPGYFFFARPGEPVVTVTAVGAVQGRGRYLVPRGTTVADLLALGGGAGADRTGRAEVRVYRDGGRVLETEVRSLYGEGAAPVALRDGDVVEVVGLVSTAPGFYVHTEPDVEPVVVTAAGPLAAPGRFVVDPGTTVGDLIALAGGTRSGVIDDQVETTSTVRLYRDGAVAFEGPLTGLYAGASPALETGDVVELEIVAVRRNSFTWRDGLSILTAALSVAVLVDRLAN